MAKNKLKLLDLFSGIGGFSLGLERTGGFETVAFCEYDEKAQKVLKKHWPDVPIFKDVRNMNYEGTVDIISGGYPCQPFSFAGKRKGTEDDRHLWPSMFKLIQKHRPTWVIGENVAGHINMGLDSVLTDLESEGYNVRTFLIPAVAVNAPHRRDRLWIVANSSRSRAGTDDRGFRSGISGACGGKNTNSERKETMGYSEHDGSSSCGDFGKFQREPDGTQTTIFEFEGTSSSADAGIVAHTASDGSCRTSDAASEKARRSNRKQAEQSAINGKVQSMADTNLQRCKRPEETRNDGKNKQKPNDKQLRGRGTTHGLSEKSKNQWLTEPAVGRVANGIPRRMDRLKQLGNAVVPQIPEILGNAILEVENYNTTNTKQKK